MAPIDSLAFCVSNFANDGYVFDFFRLVASLVDLFWIASISVRSEEHTSELQSRGQLVCRLLLEKKTSSAREHGYRPATGSVVYGTSETASRSRSFTGGGQYSPPHGRGLDDASSRPQETRWV